MSDIDADAVKKFYNEVDDIWPDKDLWFQYTKGQISKYLNGHLFAADSYILNAGSAGNGYGLPYDYHHVDIAAKHLSSCEKSTIASIENLPFPNNEFEGAICVGSVINYCNALQAISELLRVIRPGGRLILEFESSLSFEYRHSDVYGKAASITTVKYRDQEHKQWLYSPSHIFSLCSSSGGKVKSIKRFHILSSFQLGRGMTENEAVQYARYDAFLQNVPFVVGHASNVIFSCTKL